MTPQLVRRETSSTSPRDNTTADHNTADHDDRHDDDDEYDHDDDLHYYDHNPLRTAGASNGTSVGAAERAPEAGVRIVVSRRSTLGEDGRDPASAAGHDPRIGVLVVRDAEH